MVCTKKTKSEDTDMKQEQQGEEKMTRRDNHEMDQAESSERKGRGISNDTSISPVGESD